MTTRHAILARVLTSLLGLGALPASAHAGEASPWHLQLTALTDVPLDVGGQLLIEGPGRLRLATSLGVMPSPYVDVINDASVAFGGYNQQTATLIQSSLTSSLVWWTLLGWRPFAGVGFVFDVGYGLITLGGAVNAADAVSAAAGKSVSSPPGAPSYDVSSTLHLFRADVGWEWLIWEDRLVLAASLGVAKSLAASTSATPQGAARTRSSDTFGTEAATYLDGLYTTYVFTPVVSVGFGYRFF
jgi:hypothetical protein